MAILQDPLNFKCLKTQVRQPCMAIVQAFRFECLIGHDATLKYGITMAGLLTLSAKPSYPHFIIFRI